MKIEDIRAGDVLVNVDGHGAGYYKVLKVCAVMVRVRSETGAVSLAYPAIFDRKVTYRVAAFDRKTTS